MSPELELLVQFVGSVSNPFVIGSALMMPFLWPRPAAVRAAPALTAGLFGLIDAAIGGAVAWGALLVGVSMAAGAAVGQLVLFVFVPLAAAAVGAVRMAFVRLRRR